MSETQLNNMINEVEAYLLRRGEVTEAVIDRIHLLEDAISHSFLPMTLGIKLSNLKQKYGIL